MKDSSTTAGKGDVLLYYPEDGEDITAYPNYLVVDNAYTYFGVDLMSKASDMTTTVWSGDNEISFDENEYEEAEKASSSEVRSSGGKITRRHKNKQKSPG